MFKGGRRRGGGVLVESGKELHFHLQSGKKIGLSEHQVGEFNIYFLKSQGEIFLKCCTNPDISVRIIKENMDIASYFLQHNFNRIRYLTALITGG